MDLHPAVVHFPIGLLSVYSVLEVTGLKWDGERWRFARKLLVVLGVIGALAAFTTGRMTGAIGEIAEMHELFAKLSILLYGILALAYAVNWSKTASLREIILRKYVRIPLAVLGFLSLAITGALGGIMVYGPNDPFAELVYAVLIG